MTRSELNEEISITADELHQAATEIIKSLTSLESPKKAIALAREIQEHSISVQRQSEEVWDVE